MPAQAKLPAERPPSLLPRESDHPPSQPCPRTCRPIREPLDRHDGNGLDAHVASPAMLTQVLGGAAESDDRDAELLARTVARDAQAFAALYKSYYRRLYRFIFRTLARTDCIEEIINDAMLVVWDRAATYNGGSRVSTWIFGIAYNKARKHFNGYTLFEHIGDDDSDQAMADDGGLHRLELDDTIDAAFSVLSAEQRAVVELTYYQGMHYGEISRIVGCPENTVKTRMFSARKKLMAWIAHENR